MPPDYTAQLQAIASALQHSRPWWEATWIIAVGSAGIGLLSGLAGQRLQAWFERRRIRSKLVTVGYQYVGELIVVLHSLKTSREPVAFRKKTLSLVIATTPAEYMRTHREIYTTLTERQAFDVLFNIADAMKDESNFDEWLDVSLSMAALQFASGHLSLDAVGKNVGKKEQAYLADILGQYGMVRQ